MRTVLAVLACLALVHTAAAQPGWSAYESPAAGYAFAVPPGFESATQGATGSGRTFVHATRPARLTVWASPLASASGFEAVANQNLAQDVGAGWGLTSQVTTTTWSTWSATKPGRVLHQHMIALCNGSSYAAIRLEYGQADRSSIDPMVDQLIAELIPMC